MVSEGFEQSQPVHRIPELFREWVYAQRTVDKLVKAGAAEEQSKSVFARIAAIEHEIASAACTDPNALAVSIYLLCHREYGPLYDPDAAGLDREARCNQLMVSLIRAAANWVPEIGDLASSILLDRVPPAGF